jgi:hypothetical protein
MIGHDTGVQHPAVLGWRPSDPVDIAIRVGIIASHLPGREPLVRFAPGRPITLVDATTPIGHRIRLRGTATRHR